MALVSGFTMWRHLVNAALLTGHTGDVYSVAFSPDGTTCSLLGLLIEQSSYGMFQRVQKSSLPSKGHTDWVFSVAFSPDGKMLASGSNDRTIKLWEVSTGAIIATLDGHTE